MLKLKKSWWNTSSSESGLYKNSVKPVGSNETATRCTAIQMLLAGVSRELVRDALLVTNRALRKWINRFNPCGVDGLIVKNGQVE